MLLEKLGNYLYILSIINKSSKILIRKLEYNSFNVGRYSRVKNAVNLWSFSGEKDGEEKTMSFENSQSAEIEAGIT